MPLIVHLLSPKERECVDLVSRRCTYGLDADEEPNGEPFFDGPMPAPPARLFGLVRPKAPERQPVRDLAEFWATYGYPDYPRRPGQGIWSPIDRAEMLCQWLVTLYDDRPALAHEISAELERLWQGQKERAVYYFKNGGHVLQRDFVDPVVRRLSQELPRWQG